MLVTIVNCANGRVLWARIKSRDTGGAVWHCVRDSFEISAPSRHTDLPVFIQSITNHSQQLSGAVQSFQQMSL